MSRLPVLRYGAPRRSGEKQAFFNWSPDRYTAQDSANNANRLLWWLALTGLGSGASLGAGLHGAKLLNRPKEKYDPSPYTSPVKLQRRKSEEDEQEKTSAVTPGSDPVSRGVEWLSSKTQPLWQHAGKSPALKFFLGSGSSSPATVPAFWTLGLPLLGGTTYAGYKGMDKAIDTIDSQILKYKLRKAKQQYRRMLDEYSDEDKRAALRTELAALTDDVFAQAQGKQAAATDLIGTGAGMLGAWALLSYLTSGYAAHQYFNKRSPDKVTEEALRRRAKERGGGITPPHLEFA